MSEDQKTTAMQAQPVGEKEDDPWIVSLKGQMDWFIVVDAGLDTQCHYEKKDLKTGLRTAIVEGKHQQNSAVAIYAKTKEGKWTQVDNTLLGFAKSHFYLHVLYEPVWSHAMAGLKWGAITGMILKLLDTLIALGSVDPGLAFLFLIAIGACMIPRIGFVAMAVISFYLIKLSKINFFFMGIAAALAGAMLGCLPGMAIGGAIGFYRKKSLPVAQGAIAEADNLVLKAFVLPLLGGVAGIVCYFYVINPWLIKVIE